MQTKTTLDRPSAGEILTDLPIDVYHAGEGISSSTIAGWGDTCPAYWRQDRETRREPSPEMIWGDLVHSLALEPERWQERYAVEPTEVLGEPVNRRKPAHREALAEWRAGLAPGVREVTAEDLVDARRVARALRSDGFFQDLLTPDSLIEASFYWEDTRTGLLCKCRPDWFNGLAICDLKTTRDSGAAAFARQAGNLHYHTKAAWYLHGVEQVTGERPDGFVWVAINRQRGIPEYYQLDEQRLELGMLTWRKNLDELAACMERDEWPSYSSGSLMTLPLEPWRVRELESLRGEVA
jgi:hypothetical protein